MEYKKIICPCCNKEVDIPIDKDSESFDFNYSILLNSEKEFFNLVDLCPECGYAMLFDNGISDEMKEFVSSDIYLTNLNNTEIDEGLKKWVLLALLLEFDENYTEAGIAYTKAYDYLELKGMELDERYIEKAASCFLSAAEEYTSFIDAFLAIDSLRRYGDMEGAKHFLDITCDTFEGELVDKLSAKENMWIDLNVTDKRYLDI